MDGCAQIWKIVIAVSNVKRHDIAATSSVALSTTQKCRGKIGNHKMIDVRGKDIKIRWRYLSPY